MSVRHALDRLRTHTAGSPAIEFALVAPAFIALVVAILQIALVFLAENGLESAVEASGRLLMTGQAQQGAMSASQFRTAACAALPPYMSCGNLFVDVATASSYSSSDVSNPKLTYDSSGNVNNSFTYNPGSQGAIVVVRLMYLWPIATGPLGMDFSDQPGARRLLVATSVLKSEYY